MKDDLKDMSDETWSSAQVRIDAVVCLGDRWELQLHAEGLALLARALDPPRAGPGALVTARWRHRDVLALGESAGAASGWSSTGLRATGSLR
jgi:hypothetical protein